MQGSGDERRTLPLPAEGRRGEGEGASTGLEADRREKRGRRTSRETESLQERERKVERVVKAVLRAVEKTVDEMVEKMEATKVLEVMRQDVMRMRAKLEGWGEGVLEGTTPQAGTSQGGHLDRAMPTSSLSTQDLQRAFRQVFELLPKGPGGLLDHHRFQALLKEEGFKASEAEAQKAFGKLDRNGDGKVGFGDFWCTVTDTGPFLRFVDELPDSCPACELHKGYVGNGVLFELLLKLLTRRAISEESSRSLVHYYYQRMQRLEARARESFCLKTGDVFPSSSLELVETEQTGDNKGELGTKHLVGFYEAFQMLVGDRKGHILASDVLGVMYQMGIPLKNPFVPDNLKFVDFKEVDFPGFLSTVTDIVTVTRFLDPRCSGCKPGGSPELLLFRLLLKMLQSSSLEARSRATVAGYFQEKFRAFAPLWRRGRRRRGLSATPSDAAASSTSSGTPRRNSSMGESGRLVRHQGHAKRLGRSAGQQYSPRGSPEHAINNIRPPRLNR